MEEIARNDAGIRMNRRILIRQKLEQETHIYRKHAVWLLALGAHKVETQQL
jgi:hypothetical protein